MRRNRWLSLALAGATCAFLYELALACSLILQPVKGFDPQEYVLAGEVVGISGPTRIERVRGAAWGLMVKVEETVHLPQVPAKYFEVYPLDLEADCASAGRPRELMLKLYPVGAEVKVIARAAPEETTPGSGDGVLRLTVRPWANQSISLNESGQTVLFPFDYQKFEFPDGKDMPSRRREELYALPPYELRKDLIRLERADSEVERAGVLERLLFYPYPDSLDYEALVKKYVQDKTLSEGFSRRRVIEAERLRQERRRRLGG